MSEIHLPPHIILTNGLYWNTISQRWVGQYKIEKVCQQYWDAHGNVTLEEVPAYQSAEQQIQAIQKRREKVKYVKPVTLNDFDIVIPPAIFYKGETEEVEEKPIIPITQDPPIMDSPQKKISGPRGPYKTRKMNNGIAKKDVVPEGKETPKSGTILKEEEIIKLDKLKGALDYFLMDPGNPGNDSENFDAEEEKVANIGFNKREIQVLTFIAKDISYENIASRMGIGKRYVDTLIESLLAKTNSRTRIGLVTYAIDKGYYTI
jgi:DNA-binding CsgD family transcriptional regulator